jgi:nucleoside-diphosphate-sugar epimerase
MNILITGATGYIGSLLTLKLARAGEDIRILCRSDSSLPEFNLENIRVMKGDITDKSSLEIAMVGVNQVYHMAAYARLWAKDPDIFRIVNIEGTRNVLEAALKSGVTKVVYTSTAGVIGPSNDHPMREQDKRITGFFNEYEETKSEAEKIAMRYAANGLRLSIVNPARVYGPGLDTGSNPVTKIVELYMKKKWHVIPGTGEDLGSYCHVDDVVDGHISAMKMGSNGERYIFGGVNASFNELIGYIRKHSHVEKKLYHLPFPAMSAFSHVQVAWSKISGKPPMITPNWVRRYDYNWELDSSKAVNEIGYIIRNLDDGIRNTVEWIRKNRME